MGAVTCPAGHASTTTDYCDTCGAPIGAPTAGESAGADSGDGSGAAPDASAAPAPATTPCPACGEPVTARFCESCGYDVETGTPAGPPPVTLVLGADRGHWERMVGSGEPAFPAETATLSFELSGDRAVLGRVRSGAPVDVDLALTGAAADPAVSHRQCVFERHGDGWQVRDLGSANGTWVNDSDQPLAEGAAHPLAHGDRLLMGAWTCLTVHAQHGSQPGGAPEPAS